MIHTVYALRDRKAELFLQPFLSVSLGLVVRQLSDVVNSGGQDALCNHPGDFVLCKFGTFDDFRGRYDLLPNPDMILECSTLVSSKPHSSVMSHPDLVLPPSGGEGA